MFKILVEEINELSVSVGGLSVISWRIFWNTKNRINIHFWHNFWLCFYKNTSKVLNKKRNYTKFVSYEWTNFAYSLYLQPAHNYSFFPSPLEDGVSSWKISPNLGWLTIWPSLRRQDIVFEMVHVYPLVDCMYRSTVTGSACVKFVVGLPQERILGTDKKQRDRNV